MKRKTNFAILPLLLMVAMVTLLPSCEEAKEDVKKAPVSSFSLLTPANNSEGNPLSPTFTWQAADKATEYKLTVAYDDKFNAIVTVKEGITETSATLDEFLYTDGEYFWKVEVTKPAPKACAAVFKFYTRGDADIGPFDLGTPRDNATGISLAPTFKWGSAEGAATYILTVASDEGFTTGIIEKTGITGTTTALAAEDGLLVGTKYFWKVEASAPQKFTKECNAVFSFTTRAENEVSSFHLSLPADNAINISRTPSFSWTKADNATGYKLTISTSPDFATAAREKNVSVNNYTLTADEMLAYSTVYYWKVEVTSPSQKNCEDAYYTFNTMEIPIGDFRLLLPANQATGVSLKPTFTWEAATNAEKYRLTAATDSSFTQDVVIKDNIDAATREASFDVDLELGKQYYWKVEVIEPRLKASLAFFSFRTIASEFVSDFNLELPANNARNVSIKPSFRWEKPDNALKYTLIVATNANFNAGSIIGTKTDILTPSYDWATPELESFTTYYWKVITTGTKNDDVECRNVFSFLTTYRQPDGFLEDFEQYASTTDLQVIWTKTSDTGTGNLNAELTTASDQKYSGNNGIKMTFMAQTGTSAFVAHTGTVNNPPANADSLSFWMRGPVENTSNRAVMWLSLYTGTTENRYQWPEQVSTDPQVYVIKFSEFGSNVTAENVSGIRFGYEDWHSTGWQTFYVDDFKIVYFEDTILKVGDFNLIAPIGPTTPVRPEFSWTASEYATEYKLVVSKSSLFTNPIEMSGITSTSATLNTDLDFSATYYWKIVASRNNAKINESSTGVFSTVSEHELSVFNLLTPADGRDEVGLNAVFSWQASSNAVKYRLTIATNSTFTNVVGTPKEVTTTSTTFEGLSNLTRYYWKVTAINVADVTKDSTANFSFFTIRSMADGLIDDFELYENDDALKAKWRQTGFGGQEVGFELYEGDMPTFIAAVDRGKFNPDAHWDDFNGDKAIIFGFKTDNSTASNPTTFERDYDTSAITSGNALSFLFKGIHQNEGAGLPINNVIVTIVTTTGQIGRFTSANYPSTPGRQVIPFTSFTGTNTITYNNIRTIRISFWGGNNWNLRWVLLDDIRVVTE